MKVFFLNHPSMMHKISCLFFFSSEINNTMMAKKGHTYPEFEYIKSYYNAQNIMLLNLRDTT